MTIGTLDIWSGRQPGKVLVQFTKIERGIVGSQNFSSSPIFLKPLSPDMPIENDAKLRISLL